LVIMATPAMTRRVLLAATGAMGLVLAAAMGAMACTNLATLNLGTSYAQPGSTVEVTGSSFAEVGDGTQAVELRWNATEGTLLAEVEPDSAGTLSTEITVPEDAEPGHYVVVATQLAAEPGHGLESGEQTFSPVFGTPARASLVVGDPAPPQAIEPGAEPGATPADTGSGLLALSALLIVAALGLFGAGLALFTRELQHRRRSSAVPSRDEHGTS
jgi:hypothetical protein